MTKHCQSCGAELVRRDGEIATAWGKRRYCNRQCQNHGSKKAARMLALPACVNCGQTVRHGGAKYCAACQADRKRVDRATAYAARFGNRTERLLAITAHWPLATLPPVTKRLWNPITHKWYEAEVRVLR